MSIRTRRLAFIMTALLAVNVEMDLRAFIRREPVYQGERL